MFNLDKLNDHFAKPFLGQEYGEVGSLFIARQGQAFFATAEKEAREALMKEYERPIIKGHNLFLKAEKANTTPLVTTDRFSLAVVSKYDDSKVDNAKLVENMMKEFRCSEARAKEVIALSRVKPEKRSLIVTRLV